jgi:20S proteasome alpha/beta subunit
MSSDFGMENAMARANIQHKTFQLSDDCSVLLSGDLSRAKELTELCREFINKATAGNDEWGIISVLQNAAKEQKRRLADEYIGARLGISYAEFLDSGKSKLPDDLFRDLITDVKDIQLGCTLLIVDFSLDEPSLFRIHDSGNVEQCDNFAAIGSGIYIAESLLSLRDHEESLDIAPAMYNVFEAMWHGRRGPGVGEVFEIYILTRKHDKVICEVLSSRGFKYLSDQLDNFSLRDPERLKFKPYWVEPA